MSGKEYPQRKHPRLKKYDYSSPGYYFVTICTHGKSCLFGLAPHLTDYGRIAREGLQYIPKHFPGVRLDKYVVMPNHIHAIVILPPGNSGLSTLIGAYKSYVTRRIHEDSPDIRVWQESFHDHVIRDQRGYEKIWLYIDTNPLKWEDDCFYL